MSSARARARRGFLVSSSTLAVIAVAWRVPLAGVALAASSIVMTRSVMQRRRRSTMARREQLIELLERASLGMQSGSSMIAAFESGDSAACWSAPVAIARSQLLASRRVTRAPWEQVDPMGGVVADSFDLLGALGAPSSGVLAGLADAIRSEHDLSEDVVTAASQAELSALVVTLLPLGFLGFLAASGTPLLGAFLSRPVGRALCCIGIALSMCAWLWMRHLVGRVCDV